jgi:hypothetical protein
MPHSSGYDGMLSVARYGLSHSRRAASRRRYGGFYDDAVSIGRKIRKGYRKVYRTLTPVVGGAYKWVVSPIARRISPYAARAYNAAARKARDAVERFHEWSSEEEPEFYIPRAPAQPGFRKMRATTRYMAPRRTPKVGPQPVPAPPKEPSWKKIPIKTKFSKPHPKKQQQPMLLSPEYYDE